jgi:dipeptidyl aminopeptidase/acylaminoacyl peptidase
LDLKQVRCACLSPDGSRIVIAGDNTARVCDVESGKELAQLDGHSAEVTSASFSPDGSRIVTASLDNTTRVWEAANGKELARLETRSGGDRGGTNLWDTVSFSPDGLRIVTVSRDNKLRVWDGVPYRVRFAERQAVLSARPAGKQLVEEALLASNGFVEAGSRLRQERSPDPLARQAALDMPYERTGPARQHAHGYRPGWTARGSRIWSGTNRGLAKAKPWQPWMPRLNCPRTRSA